MPNDEAQPPQAATTIQLSDETPATEQSVTGALAVGCSGCYALPLHSCNWDNLNLTISMTSILGIGLFNGNWTEPLADL
jgi:hypothetical protein